MTRWVFVFRAVTAMLPPLMDGPLCGAKTRTGRPCRGVAMRRRSGGPLVTGGIRLDVPRYGRCRMHGGASTGPRTPEGEQAELWSAELGERAKSWEL